MAEKILDNLILINGTATKAPLSFVPNSSALLTIPVSGNMECDTMGIIYNTTESGRGVSGGNMFMALNAAYTTPVGTVNVLKQLFNTPAGGTFNGRVTTAYEFECLFTLTGISATSGTVAFGFLGTATYTNVYMQMIYERAALINTATASLMNSVSTATPGTVGAANTPTTAASTSTVGNFRVKGIIRVNAAGTIIPAISLSVAAACVVGNGSHFKVKPLGINTVTSVGGFV